MRAAFVTWLLAAALATGGLATVLVYLALVGYFEAPDLEAFSFDRAELATALWFLVAGHVVSRTHVSAPRCLALTRTFGAAFSYRVAPEVVVGCGSPGACAGRARLALHRRVALGVGLSIPIALVGFHALHGHPSLGGRGCLSSPLHYGGNVLFYSALALVAILSHAPLAAGCGVRTLTTEARTRRGFTSMGGGGLNGRPRPVLLAQLRRRSRGGAPIDRTRRSRGGVGERASHARTVAARRQSVGSTVRASRGTPQAPEP